MVRRHRWTQWEAYEFMLIVVLGIIAIDMVLKMSGMIWFMQ